MMFALEIKYILTLFHSGHFKTYTINLTYLDQTYIDDFFHGFVVYQHK